MKFIGLNNKVVKCSTHPIIEQKNGIVVCCICKEKLGRVREGTWNSKSYNAITLEIKNRNFKKVFDEATNAEAGF